MLRLPKFTKYALGIYLLIIFVLSLPFSFLVKNIVKNLSYFKNIKERRILLEENSRLKEEVLKLRMILSSQKTLIEENEKLRRMLDLERKYEGILIPVSVVSRSPFSWERNILLNKGRTSKIEKDDLVVDFDVNLVGKIEKVENNFSWMRILTDPNFKIIVNCKGLNVLLRGSLYEGAKLEYVPYDFDIKVGDELTISKFFGGGFRVKVGRVSSVRKDSSSLTQDVFVSPYSDIADLEEVFILKHK